MIVGRYEAEPHKLLHHGVNLLAVEQQHPQSVHAVRRLLADAYGEPLCQYLSGRKARPNMRECFDMVTRRTGRDVAAPKGPGSPSANTADLVVVNSASPEMAVAELTRCFTPSSADARRCRASPHSCIARNDPERPVQFLLPPSPASRRAERRTVRCAPDLRRKGRVRHRRSSHRQRQPSITRYHAPAERTASAVEHVLAAGASMVGKTRADELRARLDGNLQLRHADEPARARANSRWLLQRIGGDGSRSAGSPADRLARTPPTDSRKRRSARRRAGFAAPLSAGPRQRMKSTIPRSVRQARRRNFDRRGHRPIRRKEIDGATVQSSGRIFATAPPRARGVPEDGHAAQEATPPRSVDSVALAIGQSATERLSASATPRDEAVL